MEATVIQLIKKFSALCGTPKKVSPIDITYTVRVFNGLLNRSLPLFPMPESTILILYPSLFP